ncbi:MAG: hypothetical protein OXS29_02695 [bacterium]|nr:hypothetical protein [bacterium]MDE0287643.1 hypothetical protein [bacterium]MDE0438402.1 hypothetical protein [bacterium]
MGSSQETLTTTEPVRTVFFGVGTVATAALDLCRRRPWMEVVAAARNRTSAAARPAAGTWAGIRVWSDPEEMVERTRPDVALVATRSELDAVLPLIEICARAHAHVISTSEELAWPDVEKPGTGASLQRAAEEAGVVIAATGINPGFAFDALPLVLAAAAGDVSSIVVQRTLDASVFGRDVHRSLGIGYSEAGFRRAVGSRRVRGHIGFAESARIIADRMGLRIERFDEKIEPVPADRAYSLRGYAIEPPRTAGVVQLATATVGGREWLRFELSLHVAPEAVGWETRDRILIHGENELDLTIEPGMPAVSTTAALLVNAVPAVLAARPGFYPPARLLPNPPWLAAHRPPGAE